MLRRVNVPYLARVMARENMIANCWRGAKKMKKKKGIQPTMHVCQYRGDEERLSHLLAG